MVSPCSFSSFSRSWSVLEKSTLHCWFYRLVCAKHFTLTLFFDLYISLWPVTPTFDLDLWPLPWPWTCITKIKKQLNVLVCAKHWPSRWPLILTFDLDLLTHTQREDVHFCVQKFLSGLTGLAYFLESFVRGWKTKKGVCFTMKLGKRLISMPLKYWYKNFD